ncbi:MAG: hypothetical protein PVI75_01705 [Gammaproteobacteria bacterium]|jgi:hypothetical protein
MGDTTSKKKNHIISEENNYITPKKKKNILLKEGKLNTPLKTVLTPNSKAKLEKLGVEYNSDNKNFYFNPNTGSPHPKKNSSYKSSDFRLEINVVNPKTKESKKNRVFKLFGEKDKITSINLEYKKQKKLAYSITETIKQEDLIKSKKVRPRHLKGKNKSAKQIAKDLKIKDKLPYEIDENSLELLHAIAKIFSGCKIVTQDVKNTFTGTRPANINQRTIIETPTKEFLETASANFLNKNKNTTKAVKYTIELYQCEPKVKGMKNTERPHLGDLLKVSAEYRLIEDPDVIFKYSVEMPVFKTILQQNNKGEDDGDKYFRKIFNIMYEKLREHYGNSVSSTLNFNNVPMQRKRKKKKKKKKKLKLNVNLFGNSNNTRVRRKKKKKKKRYNVRLFKESNNTHMRKNEPKNSVREKKRKSNGNLSQSPVPKKKRKININLFKDLFAKSPRF